ncbi:hypothetical protein PYW07_004339 [Mythimna separata]|uniref:Uncharacterized protein n=1 Tax=Mythimna separata TaxID=271217 RepID=A0AAD7YYI5_MYTSE|nr:hypothetical protein PYW07_004339 [Mythimna separata]
MTSFSEQQASIEVDTSSIWSGLFKGLQSMLDNVNPQIGNFKAALASVPENERNHFKFVIRADRRPITAHPGWYNAPTTNERTSKHVSTMKITLVFLVVVIVLGTLGTVKSAPQAPIITAYGCPDGTKETKSGNCVSKKTQTLPPEYERLS